MSILWILTCIVIGVFWRLTPSVYGADLRLLGLLPMTGEYEGIGPVCLTSTHMALDDVNSHPLLLPDYKLTYQYVGSESEPGACVYNLYAALHSNPPFNMLLGPYGDAAAQASSQSSYLWNLTQLSYGGSSPVLSDPRRYPYFYRIGTPDSKLIQARLDLMDMFNWTKIATIHQAVESFSVVADDFIKDLRQYNITALSQEIFLRDPLDGIQNLKDLDARIIFAAMHKEHIHKLLCSAYTVGLYGPKIVWILPGVFEPDFWMERVDDIECSPEQMSEAIEGAFMMSSVFRNPFEERGVSGLTASEFDQRFLSHPQYDSDYSDHDQVAGPCYDHIWLAALSLNCTVNKLAEMGHNKTLDQFTYDDKDMNQVVFDCMGDTSMIGVSGRISFPDGDPDKIIKIERIQGNEAVLVGYYRQDLVPPHFEWIEGAIAWKDGRIPRDSTLVSNKETVLPPVLYIITCALAAIGLGLAVCFLAFNIIYKRNKTVKMSGPGINNVLLVGCIICYLTIFINTLTMDSDIVCQVRVFCLAIGFSLAYGSLFAKTWLVYRIYTSKKLTQHSMKERQSATIVCVFTMVVVLIVLAWEIVMPHVTVKQFLVNEVYVIGNDEEIHPFVQMCKSDYATYFGWAIYIVEGLWLAFGAFLAWETRKVNIETLNDSHVVGMSVYNVVILGAVGLALSLLLDEQIVVLYGVTSGCILIGSTLTLLVVFIPKVRAVYTAVDIVVTTNVKQLNPDTTIAASTVNNPTVLGTTPEEDEENDTPTNADVETAKKAAVKTPNNAAVNTPNNGGSPGNGAGKDTPSNTANGASATVPMTTIQVEQADETRNNADNEATV